MSKLGQLIADALHDPSYTTQGIITTKEGTEIAFRFQILSVTENGKDPLRLQEIVVFDMSREGEG